MALRMNGVQLWQREYRRVNLVAGLRVIVNLRGPVDAQQFTARWQGRHAAFQSRLQVALAQVVQHLRGHDQIELARRKLLRQSAALEVRLRQIGAAGTRLGTLGRSAWCVR